MAKQQVFELYWGINMDMFHSHILGNEGDQEALSQNGLYYVKPLPVNGFNVESAKKYIQSVINFSMSKLERSKDRNILEFHKRTIETIFEDLNTEEPKRKQRKASSSTTTVEPVEPATIEAQEPKTKPE